MIKLLDLLTEMVNDPKIGKEFWFEYHCFESDCSADAEVWYRSHQKVKVLRRGVDDHDEFPDEPKTYVVQFADGFEYNVFDDELMDDPSEFYRPDPPKRKNINEGLNLPKKKHQLSDAEVGDELLCNVSGIKGFHAGGLYPVLKVFPKDKRLNSHNDDMEPFTMTFNGEWPNKLKSSEIFTLIKRKV